LERGSPAEATEALRQAREWPANMGVGKPYPEFVDQEWEGAIALMVDDAKKGHLPMEGGVHSIREKIKLELSK